ncbi:GMC family oxidoreductase N-terminal domain-containing protein [Acetobacteraceae bacterium H6797]|nr:GMC family oxidoreductase N-terminal domain-containing protein [Acetobacteraceae bacterium H6797]
MTFDDLVIGGGAAGCLLAARLSENPSRRVALIEAGGGKRGWLHSIPGLGPFAAKAKTGLWRHQGEAEENLAGRSAMILQGMMLGGSAALNGMVYTRGHAADYDAWGVPGWSARDVLPYFARGKRPVPVRASRPASPLPGRFIAAAGEAGFAITDDLNADAIDAFGLTEVTIAGGQRANTRRILLEPALGRENLTIFTGARARRLLIEAGRVTGVEIQYRGERLILRVEREVVLAAGGIGSPHLLLASGIGPADALRAVGVTPRHDLPGVGQGLQNHPSFALRYRIEEPVSLKRYTAPLAGLGALWSYWRRGEGPLAEGVFNAAGFVRTQDDLAAPDAQIVMSPVLFPAEAATGLSLLPKRHGLTLAVQQGSPFSRGEVTLASADPLAPPRIRTGAFTDRRDIEVLGRAIRIARRIMRQPAMRGAVPELPDEAFDTPEAMEASIRSLAGTAYHQCGTCRMGEGPLAVVDETLRLHGLAGLRVADGSIIPRLHNAALQAPTMMIAERAAEFIAAEG